MPELARHDLAFLEIAGNDEILMTVVIPAAHELRLPDTTMLDAQPVLTQPGMERRAIRVAVARLAEVLRAVAQSPARDLHLYDY
jgi:hypothetical protein